MNMVNNGYIIYVKGLVQGIGFRPFIYRVAKDMSLCGSVENNSAGVVIKLICDSIILDVFVGRIKAEAPKIARITDISFMPEYFPDCDDFKICKSTREKGITHVSPDIAICDECLTDRQMQPHRLSYPFTNCTYCGPRFTIIKNIPYDRVSTTMQPFAMCEKCADEYNNPMDRRFHAQPVACNNCGPHYQYYDRNRQILNSYTSIFDQFVTDIEEGWIVAIKSLGGYNIVCDADNVEAVKWIRRIKDRPRKPFAVMVANVNEATKIAFVNETECEALTSWQRPIVILDRKIISKNDVIAPNYRTIGVMLPYMAIHHDFFAKSCVRRLIVTSGNRGKEPIMIDDKDALKYFGSLNIPVISYNREIYNRIDDSIVQIVDNRMRVLRRARGFIPEPIFNDISVDGIFGVGAEIISHFAIGCRDQIIESQYFGSLEKIENEAFYKESYEKLSKLYFFEPRMIVTDMHPKYRSTLLGCKITGKASVTKMWHHHAHAVSAMVEYGLREKVIALCLDGVGYGTDGTMWGGELIKCDRTDFERLYHLPILPMPGGDKASLEPWRMAISLIYTVYGDLSALPPAFVKRIGEANIDVILRMIERGFNSPLSSGAGRLFDAVSSLLGVADKNSYEAEAPILLEQLANPENYETYNDVASYKSLLDCILQDISDGVDRSIISSRFHNTLADMLVNVIVEFAGKEHISTIILTGGVFQNKLLATRFITLLREYGLNPLLPALIPCNDAGISIGQVAYGAEMLRSKL